MGGLIPLGGDTDRHAHPLESDELDELEELELEELLLLDDAPTETAIIQAARNCSIFEASSSCSLSFGTQDKWSRIQASV